jgi:RNA polymerase sigma-70 factor (ECF subfamily)
MAGFPMKPTLQREPDPAPGGGAAVFATTHWSVVLEAGNQDSPRASEALEQLCRVYWRPLYAYVRKRGYSPDEAPDLVQEFFARIIEKNYFSSADRQRGRFRTFLLASMEHFLAKEWQRAHRLKRGGGVTFLSLDDVSAETLYREEPADELTAERLYDRRWALALLEQALAQLRAEYAGSGRGPVFEELAVVLSGDKPEVAYAELGARLGLSEGAVKVAVHRLRQRYGELVRMQVADTVSRPEQVDEELQHLFAALGR